MDKEEHIVKIISKKPVTYNTINFRIEKPLGYNFIPGQATDVSLKKPGFEDRKSPFTFVNSPKDNFLEFIIKIYNDNEGLTYNLSKMKTGEEIILREVRGSIKYKGPGTFIAAGSGITPFISIFKDLNRKNQLHGNSLLFSNKTKKDIILEQELNSLFKEKVVFTLTQEKNKAYRYGRINQELISSLNKPDQKFYICGPLQFVVDMKKTLDNLGVDPDNVIIEL